MPFLGRIFVTCAHHLVQIFLFQISTFCLTTKISLPDSTLLKGVGRFPQQIGFYKKTRLKFLFRLNLEFFPPALGVKSQNELVQTKITGHHLGPDSSTPSLFYLIKIKQPQEVNLNITISGRHLTMQIRTTQSKNTRHQSHWSVMYFTNVLKEH